MAADVPFPLEDRIKRRNRKLTINTQPTAPELPRQSAPLQIFGAPSGYITLNGSFRSTPETGTTRDASLNISTTNEVMGHTIRTLSTFGPGSTLEGLTVTGEKQSETDSLLGPLHARRYEFGDIQSTNLTLAGDNEEGFGARVSNALEGEIAGSTTRTFEGDIPPEWDIELYDGTQLIDFQTSGPDGRYRFENIDLYAGDNDFRLVFYGPQGELREESVTIPVSLESVGQDKKLYDISLTLNNIKTYEYIKSEDEDRGEPHLVVSYQQGITDGLSVNTGLRSRAIDGARSTIATGGIVARLGNTLMNVTLATDKDLESGIETIVRQTWGRHSLRSSTFLSTDSFNPDNSDSPNTFQSTLDLRGPIAKIFGQEFSYTLSGGSSKNTDDGGTNRVALGQSGRIGRFTVGHTLDYTSTTADDDTTDRLRSLLTLRRSIGETRIASTLSYTYAPDPTWESFLLSLSRNLGPNVQGSFDIEHNLNTPFTTLGAQLSWQKEQFVLSPRLTYDTDKNIQASVNLRIGLSYNQLNKTYEFTREQINNQGTVDAFVYFDKDGNKKFDGADEPIKDARVSSVQVTRAKQTDENGHAHIYNLPEYEPTDIVLEQSSLSDPYLVPGSDGASVYPTPGQPITLEFPVHMSGEMDGTIYRQTPRGLEPTGGVNVQLVNERGDVAFSTLTAYDGYYVLSIIPPGRYLLMVRPDDLRDTGLRQPWPMPVTIGYDGKVLAGQNIVLASGNDIPLAFHRLPKWPKPTDTPVPDTITMTFGQYKSSLLA